MDSTRAVPLALRVVAGAAPRDIAIEPDRAYLIGSAMPCDLRADADGLRAVHATIELHCGALLLAATGEDPVLRNDAPVTSGTLELGDTLALGALTLQVVHDEGLAELLPVPLLVARRRAGATPPPVVPMPPGDARTFRELMAQELAHAPALSISLLVHALLLLLLWWLFPPDPQAGRTAVVFGVLDQRGPLTGPPVPPAPPVEIEAAEPLPTELPELEPAPAAAAEPAAPAPDDPRAERDRALLAGRIAVAPRGPVRGTGDLDALVGGGGTDGGGFRQTVSELRRTGLEIVFVVDSTGSMGSSIDATKAQIAGMLEVLRALVPDARFGLVTYRDRGGAEEYLLRIQPLGGDFYAACNFMQFIAADGGGDRPEAVLAGLEAAFHQEFRHSARRVVVLAGDAPPHPEEERRLLEAVRRFTDGGTSFVHALVTGRAGVDGRDVETAFRRIAERGRGVYARIEDPDRILQEVLAAAFGSRYAGNLAIVQQRLAAQRAAPPTWALDLARSGEGLQKELQRHPVADELVQALLRRPSRAAALQLVKTLGAPASSAAARQAAAYVLQRLLRLAAPPIDPLAPRPLTPTAADQLRAAITAQLPR